MSASSVAYLRWESPLNRAVLAAIAAALGLGIARLPATWSAALLVGVAIVILVFAQPLIGLGLAVILGPARPLLAATYHSAALDPGQAFFALAVAAYLARGALRHEIQLPLSPRTVPFVLPLLGYVAVGVISLWGARSVADGLVEVIKWAELLAVAALVARQPRWAWAMVGFALAAGAAQAAIGVWQFGLRGAGPEHFRILGDHFRAYGTFEQPNPFGGFMGLAWPVGAGLGLGGLAAVVDSYAGRRERRWSWKLPVYLLACGLVALLCLSALYFSFSRGAWLGAAAAAGAMLVFWPRRRWVGVALIVVGVGAVLGLRRSGLLPSAISARLADVGEFTQVYDVRGVDINDTNYAILERLAHWQAGLNMAAAHPWLGVGIGNYEAAYPEFRLFNWPIPLGHAHNIYVNVLAETGVLGLAAYGLMWAGIVWATISVLNRTSGWERGLALGLMGAWAHLAAHQIVDNLYVNNIHLYLGALLGALAVLASRREGSSAWVD